MLGFEVEGEKKKKKNLKQENQDSRWMLGVVAVGVNGGVGRLSGY